MRHYVLIKSINYSNKTGNAILYRYDRYNHEYWNISIVKRYETETHSGDTFDKLKHKWYAYTPNIDEISINNYFFNELKIVKKTNKNTIYIYDSESDKYRIQGK